MDDGLLYTMRVYSGLSEMTWTWIKRGGSHIWVRLYLSSKEQSPWASSEQWLSHSTQDLAAMSSPSHVSTVYNLGHRGIGEARSTGWNSWARDSAVDTQSHGALQEMQQAIKVASATWRYWLDQSAWAHVMVPAEMLARSFTGLEWDQFSTIASVCDCLGGCFHYFNWILSLALFARCICAFGPGLSFLTHQLLIFASVSSRLCFHTVNLLRPLFDTVNMLNRIFSITCNWLLYISET